MKKSRIHNEQGNALLAVLIILGLALVITEGMLDSSATNSKTRAVVNTQSRYYYEVEQTLSAVVGWLQDNSKNIVTAFNSTNFNNNFTLGAPSLGDNEGEHFGVHTLVKMNGTNNSVMLSNNSFFGTPAFPATNNIDTNASFNAVTAFQNADIGPANARIVLVWARLTDGNYEPIFRVDVITGNNPDRGVHSFSYVQSTLVTSGGSVIGYYGRDYLTFNTPNNTCASYQYTYNAPGSWTRGAVRSNCPTGSNGMLTTKANISGTAKSLIDPGVTLQAPTGNVSGEICEGAGCHTYALTDHGAWATHCAGTSPNATISSNTTWNTGGCWNTVTINNNRTLTLTDTTNPYYIRYINYSGSNSRLAFGNLAQGQDLELFTDVVANDHFNGNRLFNTNNAPHQVKIRYTGTNAFKLNGTAVMNAIFESSYANIEVLGNFNFYGAIRAPTLLINGNATVYYDEAIGVTTPTLSDMNFSLKKSSQRYR